MQGEHPQFEFYQEVTLAIDEVFAPTEAVPSEEGLWPGDCGTLPLNARRALLQLLRGPMVTASRHGELWAPLGLNRPSSNPP